MPLGVVFVVAASLVSVMLPKQSAYAETFTITTTVDEDSHPAVGEGCSFYEAG
jgi:hypothetical protein